MNVLQRQRPFVASSRSRGRQRRLECCPRSLGQSLGSLRKLFDLFPEFLSSFDLLARDIAEPRVPFREHKGPSALLQPLPVTRENGIARVARSNLQVIRFDREKRARGETNQIAGVGKRIGFEYRVLRRVAGAGSLGCPRFVVLTKWGGGMIAREVKALPPSAHVWAGNADVASAGHPQRAAHAAVRAHDPLLHFGPGWRIRRLAPDCCELDLADLPGKRDEHRLLRAMGKETANVHCGSHDSLAAVRDDLAARGPNWLLPAARTMATPVRGEWKEWKAVRRELSEA